MKGLILSFRSEFYKSRKTLGFWASIILPSLIGILLFVGFYSKSEKLLSYAPMALWLKFTDALLGNMGSLVLPMYIVFLTYSVNNIEHRADTWKTLFNLPVARRSIYAAKYFYALFLVFMCLTLFLLLTIVFGTLLSAVKPELRFVDFHMEKELAQMYCKLFFSSLGILSIQFLFSLLWADFLKPIGIGFVCTIAGVILAMKGWEYAYLFPYSHPMEAIYTMIHHGESTPSNQLQIDVFTKDVFVSLGVAVVVFIAGYFIVQRKRA